MFFPFPTANNLSTCTRHKHTGRTEQRNRALYWLVTDKQQEKTMYFPGTRSERMWKWRNMKKENLEYFACCQFCFLLFHSSSVPGFSHTTIIFPSLFLVLFHWTKTKLLESHWRRQEMSRRDRVFFLLWLSKRPNLVLFCAITHRHTTRFSTWFSGIPVHSSLCHQQHYICTTFFGNWP